MELLPENSTCNFFNNKKIRTSQPGFSDRYEVSLFQMGNRSEPDVMRPIENLLKTGLHEDLVFPSTNPTSPKNKIKKGCQLTTQSTQNSLDLKQQCTKARQSSIDIGVTETSLTPYDVYEKNYKDKKDQRLMINLEKVNTKADHTSLDDPQCRRFRKKILDSKIQYFDMNRSMKLTNDINGNLKEFCGSIVGANTPCYDKYEYNRYNPKSNAGKNPIEKILNTSLVVDGDGRRKDRRWNVANLAENTRKVLVGGSLDRETIIKDIRCKKVNGGESREAENTNLIYIENIYDEEKDKADKLLID